MLNADVVRLIVFAKAPVAGAVKTRLAPALGAAGASRLHARLVEHTVSKALAAAALGVGRLPFRIDVELACAPDGRHPLFQRIAAQHPMRVTQQRGADLGERMFNALADCGASTRQAILIGCDCPGLSAHELVSAAAWLRAGDDAVLGPALDGGYYLVGCRAPCVELFEGIAWSTSRVMCSTRARLRELGWRWRELPPYPDIDRPADLAHLPPGLLVKPGVTTTEDT